MIVNYDRKTLIVEATGTTKKHENTRPAQKKTKINHTKGVTKRYYVDYGCLSYFLKFMGAFWNNIGRAYQSHLLNGALAMMRLIITTLSTISLIVMLKRT